MQITVNGETYTIPSPTSVSGLVAELNLDARKIAIERNLEIIPRSEYDSTSLGEGDELEIIHFIGGG